MTAVPDPVDELPFVREHAWRWCSEREGDTVNVNTLNDECNAYADWIVEYVRENKPSWAELSSHAVMYAAFCRQRDADRRADADS